MDYYSEMDMPDVDERKKKLIAYANTIRIVPDLELEQIVARIVSETKKYSLTGYNMYGVFEERSKLEKALKNNVH